MSEVKHDNRMLAIGLALGGAACLIYAALSRHWLVDGRVEVMFGLRDNISCGLAEHCDPISNSELVDAIQHMSGNAPDMASSAFAPMGWVTMITCSLAALGLLVAGALGLAKKRPMLPISPSTVALLAIMAGLISGCVFVATKPGGVGYVGVSLGFWLFGIGSVAGIAGAQLLAKINRAPDPDLMDGAMNPDDF
ncbi:MAG TPA: hypothetical protein VGG74_29790 [Kofleriaceae bacterium]|jgi:hypothetical protein